MNQGWEGKQGQAKRRHITGSAPLPWYSVCLLNSWLFSHPHARRLCLPTVSVTGDQTTSSFINHVPKSNMFSLNRTHAAGQCSLFDLQPAPSGITLDAELLRMSQRTCHHKTGGPETRKVQIIPLPNQYIQSTSLITDSQDRSITPCAGDRNVFNYTSSLDFQVANCSLQLAWYGSSLLPEYTSEAANAESSYSLD